MFRANPIQWGLTALLAVLLSAPVTAQETGVGVGADGFLWASGWTHAQVNVSLTRELRIQVGAGMLRSANSPVSALLRPRPGAFDRAGLMTLGVRANPGLVDGRPFRGVIGMEWAAETFVKNAAAEWGTLGLMKWSRRDVRLIAGAEWVSPSGWAFTVLAGVGHTGTAGEGFDPQLSRRVQNGPVFARMFGLEVTKWLSRRG